MLSHQALPRAVWGPDFPATTDNLKVLVSRLRAKVERPGGPVYIETDRGIGYRLARPAGAASPPPSPSANGRADRGKRGIADGQSIRYGAANDRG